MSWEFQDHLPIYAQLMDTLKRRIVTGRRKAPLGARACRRGGHQSQHRPARVF